MQATQTQPAQATQAPAPPATPKAPLAPVGPVTAAPTPAPGTITIVGADGKTQTIVLPGESPVIGGSEVAAAPPPAPDAEFAQGFTAGVFSLLFAFGLFKLYRRFKRRGMKPAVQNMSLESPERLERMERGIEAIAIEVERISEGQRFVTNLLAESRAPAVPSQSGNR